MQDEDKNSSRVTVRSFACGITLSMLGFEDIRFPNFPGQQWTPMIHVSDTHRFFEMACDVGDVFATVKQAMLDNGVTEAELTHRPDASVMETPGIHALDTRVNSGTELRAIPINARQHEQCDASIEMSELNSEETTESLTCSSADPRLVALLLLVEAEFREILPKTRMFVPPKGSFVPWEIGDDVAPSHKKE